MRYPILKRQAQLASEESGEEAKPAEFIQPDSEKLVKIVRAYNNSDP